MEPSINSAIKKGYFKQVRFLVAFGNNVNARDETYKTPLMNCALIEDEKWGIGLSRILIEKGAVMAYRDKRGMNVLHYACTYERKKLVELLLQSPDLDIAQGDLVGNIPLHYAVSLGNVTITKLLMEAMSKYSLNVDKPNRKGITPLMQAWKSGHEECAKVLLNEGNADETLADYIEKKSSKDYEEEYRISQDIAKYNQENQRPRLYGHSIPRYMRPVSAATTLHRSTVSLKEAPQKLRSRPNSAILLRRASTSTEPETLEPLQEIEKEKRAGKVFRSASYSNLRNKPEYILNVTPIECFVNDPQYQSRRKRSSIGQDNHVKIVSESTWKGELFGMYSAFQFQFTGSFRLPAKPSEADLLCGSEDRINSPQPSDCDSMRDPNNMNNMIKKVGRRTMGVKSAFGDQKVPRKSTSLRPSAKKISSQVSTINSLKAQQVNMDASSTESVNSGMRSAKKRNASSNSDMRDDMSDISNFSADKSTKSRSRKISTSSFDDNVTGVEQSSRTASKGITIPVVMEPPGQEQLDAINE